jgi:hypothetical protein
VVLTVFSFVAGDTAIFQPTELVIPSILVLLPLSYLFPSVHSTELKEAGQSEEKEHGIQHNPGMSTRKLVDNSLGTTMVSEPMDIPELPTGTNEMSNMTTLDTRKHDPFLDPVERELREIDSIQAAAEKKVSDEFVIECSPEKDVMKQRARRVISNLASRSVTPVTSQVGPAQDRS